MPPEVVRPHPRPKRPQQAMSPLMNQTTHEIMMPAPGMPMPPPANGAAPMETSPTPAPRQAVAG